MRKGTIWIFGATIAAGAVFMYFNAGKAPESSVEPEELAQGAPMVEVKLPSELSPQAQMGETAFNAKCAVCHGANAAGQNGVAPPLVHVIYEPSHHGDGAFLIAAQRGVRAHHWRFGNMPPVEGLTNSDIGNIVAYVRELQRENGIN